MAKWLFIVLLSEATSALVVPNPTLPSVSLPTHWPSTILPYLRNHTIKPVDNHICLLNYPKSSFCQSWRVLPVIILSNNNLAVKNLAAIKQFIEVATQSCGGDSFLMPFTPFQQNDNCYEYQLGNATDGKPNNASEWFSQLHVKDVLVPNRVASVTIFEQILVKMYNCTQKNHLNKTAAGAVFLFHDFKCLEFVEARTFWNLTGTVLFDLSISKYVTAIYALGHYNVIGETCMRVVLFLCTIFFKRQICGMKFYSDLDDFVGNATVSQTCPYEAPPDPTTNETVLILEIVVPIVVVTVLLAVAVIIFVMNRSRRKWFKFWWEHTKGDMSLYGQHMSPNEYFEMTRKRNDEWEIDPKHLEVKLDEPLGHGAFAVVSKGLLKDGVPLFGINSSLTTQIEGKMSGGYEVAVKRLPNHADNQARKEFRLYFSWRPQRKRGRRPNLTEC